MALLKLLIMKQISAFQDTTIEEVSRELNVNLSDYRNLFLVGTGASTPTVPLQNIDDREKMRDTTPSLPPLHIVLFMSLQVIVWTSLLCFGMALAIVAAQNNILRNPKAVTAAVTGTADIAYGVATGGTTNGKNADTVAQRANARPSTTGSTFSTVLFYLVMIGLALIIMKYLLRGSFRRIAVPLLIIGVLLCFGVTAEASMLSSIPEMQCAASVLVKPIAHFVVLLVTIASIFL